MTDDEKIVFALDFAQAALDSIEFFDIMENLQFEHDIDDEIVAEEILDLIRHIDISVTVKV